MLKTLVYFLVLVVVSASAFSQRSGVWNIVPYPATQSSGTGQQTLISAANSTDIATITDATNGVFQHEVRVTHDSGSTWHTLLTERIGSIRWWTIHHPLPSTYLVTGDSSQNLGKFGLNYAYKYFGVFYFSKNNGLLWKKTVLDSNTIVYSGYMQNELEGALIVGYPGNVFDSAANQPQDSLLVTTDGWTTWTARGLPHGAKGCWQLLGLGKGSYLTYSSYPRKLYVTTDDGVHWAVSDLPKDYGIKRIAALTPQHLVAVGGRWESNGVRTLMYETFDQGKTWIVRLDTTMGTTNGFSSVSFSEDKLHGVALGGRIMRTEDGGATWEFDDPPSGLGLYPDPALDVYTSSQRFALAVMPQDRLLRFDGKKTLRAPMLHDHEPGPLALGPTPIAWTPIEGATGYRLQVSGHLMSSSTYDSTVYRTPLLDTLVSDTTCLFNADSAFFYYYVRVEAVNDTEHSSWTEKVGLFYTVSAPDKKLPPKIISPANGSHHSHSITLHWTPVEGAVFYELKLWPELMSTPYETLADSTSITLTDLDAPASYAVQIRAIGDEDNTDWSNGNFYFSMDAADVSGWEQSGFSLYPNPAQHELHVSYPQLEARNIRIYDCMGKRLSLPWRQEEVGAIVFDLQSIPSGMYTLVLEGKDRIIRRVQVLH